MNLHLYTNRRHEALDTVLTLLYIPRIRQCRRSWQLLAPNYCRGCRADFQVLAIRVAVPHSSVAYPNPAVTKIV